MRALKATIIAVLGIGVAACAGPGGAGSGASAPAAAAASTVAHSDCLRLLKSTVDECEATVRRLNGVLAEKLRALLPPTAALTNNLIVQGMPALEVTFLPHPSEEGGIVFESLLRVRDSERTAGLEVAIGGYTDVPTADGCPDQAQAKEMQSKGMVLDRCDRTVVGTSVVLVSDTSEPSGSGEWAQVMRRNLVVTAYHKDGTRVRVSLAPIVERAKDPQAAMKEVAGLLTLDQVQALAMDPDFTAGSQASSRSSAPGSPSPG
jgi:hypothetical protein